MVFWYPTNWVNRDGTSHTRSLKCITTVCLSGVSIRLRYLRKKGAEPPCESGLTLCSTVNLTSSAVSSPQPSWNITPERSLNVHVRISFDGWYVVANPGRYAKVGASRM